MEQFFIVDGTNLFYRAYHAPFRNLDTTCPECRGSRESSPTQAQAKFGTRDCPNCHGTGREPTKATWLFTKQLLQLIRSERPDFLAVVFDGPRAALRRRAVYSKYKEKRSDIPHEVVIQQQRVKEIVRALGVCLVQCEGYEADDAMATLAIRYACPNREVNIVTRDKDLRQLCVNPDIFVLDPIDKVYYAERNAGEKWGIRTGQITEFLMLMGDSTDNVPGVKGFGEVTAAHYLKEHGNIKDMIIAATMGKLKPKHAEQLVKAHQSGWLDVSRSLIALDCKVNLKIKRETLVCRSPDMKAAGRIFRTLGFKTLE